MKIVHQFGAQGDVVFIRVAKLPKDATPVEYGHELVIAHSETGHHHVIERPDASIMLFNTPNPLISYLQLRGRAVADVVHLRDFDTHESLRLEAEAPDSTWEIRRQREWDNAAARQVND